MIHIINENNRPNRLTLIRDIIVFLISELARKITTAVHAILQRIAGNYGRPLPVALDEGVMLPGDEEVPVPEEPLDIPLDEDAVLPDDQDARIPEGPLDMPLDEDAVLPDDQDARIPEGPRDLKTEVFTPRFLGSTVYEIDAELGPRHSLSARAMSLFYIANHELLTSPPEQDISVAIRRALPRGCGGLMENFHFENARSDSNEDRRVYLEYICALFRRAIATWGEKEAENRLSRGMNMACMVVAADTLQEELVNGATSIYIPLVSNTTYPSRQDIGRIVQAYRAVRARALLRSQEPGINPTRLQLEEVYNSSQLNPFMTAPLIKQWAMRNGFFRDPSPGFPSPYFSDAIQELLESLGY